jgi:hypothetical protein
MGFKKQEDAMTVMLMAVAEGYHPMIGIRDYHLIQGKPALKADAMLARFQKSGGKVKWIKLEDAEVSAEFTHPSGGTALIGWDMKRAKQAQLGSNGMWAKYPRQMLRARVISEGIRTVFPGVIVGSYTPEEVQDFDGVTIEGESKPDLSMAIDREQAEQVHTQALLKIAAADSLESLQRTWAGYARTLKSMPEDLAADLIQKKDEMKAELSQEGELK